MTANIVSQFLYNLQKVRSQTFIMYNQFEMTNLNKDVKQKSMRNSEIKSTQNININ